MRHAFSLLHCIPYPVLWLPSLRPWPVPGVFCGSFGSGSGWPVGVIFFSAEEEDPDYFQKNFDEAADVFHPPDHQVFNVLWKHCKGPIPCFEVALKHF